MKKKLLAAIAASALLCGVLSAPASAAGYKKGDVDMDGEITVEDAQLALIDYTEYLIAEKKHVLNDEQLELGDINGKSDGFSDAAGVMRYSPITVEDVHAILVYYTECLANDNLKEQDIVSYMRDKHPNLFK